MHLSTLGIYRYHTYLISFDAQNSPARMQAVSPCPD